MTADGTGNSRGQLYRLKAWDAFLADSPLRLEGPGLGTPGAWFLGPKAENKELLVELITAAIAEHCAYRTSYHPEDPEMIDKETKASPEYVAAVAALRREAQLLNAKLKQSAPIFSMRSHGHMLWDQVLPAMVGYFAGMLYNQNNVAAEASPITTWLEILVGNDLCRMLGYPVPSAKDGAAAAAAIVPWGHITCDGSVANIEALWAARNAKFFALAVRAALRELPLLRPARDIDVGLLDGSRARLIDLDTWTLLNLKIDDVADLPQRIAAADGDGGLKTNAVVGALKPYLLPNIGMVEFYQRFMAGYANTPVAMVPSTRHYSWPKAGTLLGIGQNNILKIHVDLRARMHVPALVDKLHECLLKRVPVMAVVAVIGTTEESAVDPLREILDVREAFRKEGLDFAVHCDAAWGGYFNSMYREDDDGLKLMAAAPEFPMSEYVTAQYRALGEADSITVDPHKAGFVPYPAGGLCYRNSTLRDLISLKAPVVYHSTSEPTVGIYGIEGSKPGAAAAAVYLAHKVIRPTKQGYGKILGQCVWTSKRMYCRLLTMQDRDPRQPPDFKIELLQMLPAEREGLGSAAIKRQRDMIASFVDLDNAQLLARLQSEPEAMDLFKEIGSDQVILSYAFNFRDPKTGDWNTDPEAFNKLNNRIYDICSISDPKEDPNTVDLILTGSEFDVESYGRDFVEHFSRRLGLVNPEGKSIGFLISTTMNPWTTDTPGGDFLAVVEDALRKSVYQAMKDLKPKTIAPYGSWPSPITADLIVKKSIRLSEVRCDGGDVYWLESRPKENGRSVVVRHCSKTNEIIDITPPFVAQKPFFDVRTHIYSYGGGAWVVDRGVLYFSNVPDGRLYRQDGPGSLPAALTPKPPASGKPIRHYGDGFIDRARGRWIGVVEDWSDVDKTGEDPRKHQPAHRIVAVDFGSGQLDPGTPLVEGHDFFSSPRLSPDGRHLAWLAWDHPRMPWEGTTLYLSELGKDGKPDCAITVVAGGARESIFQPEWSPDGAELWFVSDRSGWWNLYRYDLASKQVRAVAPVEAEFGQPQWNLGQSTYCFTTGGRVVAACSRDGLTRLARIVPATGEIIDIDVPYSSFESVRSGDEDRVVFVAGAPGRPSSVVLLDLRQEKQRILKKATDLADDPAISRHLADVEPVDFPTGTGETAHGLYYPPANADYAGPADEKPPLVVMCHGGPTAQASPTLKFDIQYWTSRGIAVLDVNYRGSSGFGRAYRDRLFESWGIVDVEDCINGARYLASAGKVDGARAVITGRSAGGYTTLAALTFHDYFRAGASHYGIGDLETLAKDTHKFESHYLDWLVGPYPEQIDRYRARSPRYHVDRLSRPVIFFQGADDEVVPPNQAEAMVEAIKRRGLPVGYLLFEGERHGFRQEDNIRRAIEAEHYFFSFEVFRSRLTFGAPVAKGLETQASGTTMTPASSNGMREDRLQAFSEDFASSRSYSAGGQTSAQTSRMETGGTPMSESAQTYAFVTSHNGHHGQPDDEVIGNERMYHAFALLGKERLFASHLTMLHWEPHMYQFVIQVSLPEPWREKYMKVRLAHPQDSFFIANTVEDAAAGNPFSDSMTVPELQSRLRTCFVGNIFHGIPFKPVYDHWPWAGVKPVLANIPVTVERIVHFRPFADTMNFPCTQNYLLFGAGNEAHMVYFQTKQPDYDHVVSLTAAPPWLAQDLLQAGAMVDLPDVPRLGPGDEGTGVRCKNPLQQGSTVHVRYRGKGQRRPVTIDHSPWFCTKITNHPDPCGQNNCPCGSATPGKYLSTS